MIIEKKAWPKYFQSIMEGKKKFDLRLADFECKEGDILVLKEWDPDKQQFTGRTIQKIITYIMKTKEQKFFSKENVEKYGFQIMSFE